MLHLKILPLLISPQNLASEMQICKILYFNFILVLFVQDHSMLEKNFEKARLEIIEELT